MKKKEALCKIRATTDAAVELFQGGIYVHVLSTSKLCGLGCIGNIITHNFAMYICTIKTEGLYKFMVQQSG